MILGVRHEPQDHSCFVADASYVAMRTIGVAARIGECNLVVALQLGKCVVVACETTLAVGNRAVDLVREVLESMRTCEKLV